LSKLSQINGDTDIDRIASATTTRLLAGRGSKATVQMHTRLVDSEFDEAADKAARR